MFALVTRAGVQSLQRGAVPGCGVGRVRVRAQRPWDCSNDFDCGIKESKADNLQIILKIPPNLSISLGDRLACPLICSMNNIKPFIIIQKQYKAPVRLSGEFPAGSERYFARFRRGSRRFQERFR